MSKLEYMQDLERQLSEAQQRSAKLRAENERLRAVIGSVSEHDRVLGAHIAAAMKKYDLRARAEKATEMGDFPCTYCRGMDHHDPTCQLLVLRRIPEFRAHAEEGIGDE